jgi:hypothetical protein
MPLLHPRQRAACGRRYQQPCREAVALICSQIWPHGAISPRYEILIVHIRCPDGIEAMQWRIDLTHAKPWMSWPSFPWRLLDKTKLHPVPRVPAQVLATLHRDKNLLSTRSHSHGLVSGLLCGHDMTVVIIYCVSS